jgi:hypothetical protein
MLFPMDHERKNDRVPNIACGESVHAFLSFQNATYTIYIIQLGNWV